MAIFFHSAFPLGAKRLRYPYVKGAELVAQPAQRVLVGECREVVSTEKLARCLFATEQLTPVLAAFAPLASSGGMVVGSRAKVLLL